MSKNKISWPKKLFIVLVLILAVIGLLNIRARHNENHSRTIMAQAVSTVGTPTNCLEKSREYQVGSLDVQSTWYVAYDCTNLRGEDAFNDIVSRLAKLGFTSTTVKWPVDNVTVRTKDYELYYGLIPTKDFDLHHGANIDALSREQLDQLEGEEYAKEMLSGIRLTVTRE